MKELFQIMYFNLCILPLLPINTYPFPNAHSLLLNMNPQIHLWLRIMWINCMVSPSPSHSTFLVVIWTLPVSAYALERHALLSQGPRSLGHLLKWHLEWSPLGISISPSHCQVEWSPKQYAEVLACWHASKASETSAEGTAWTGIKGMQCSATNTENSLCASVMSWTVFC